MVMKNNIKALIKERGISIRKMSMDLDMDYAFTHGLTNREDLSTTQFGTVKKIADYLGVSVEEVYKDS